MAVQFEIVGAFDEAEIRGDAGVDPDNDLAFYTWDDSSGTDFRLYSADISDESNPSPIGFINSTALGSTPGQLRRIRVDREDQYIILQKDDAGDAPGIWLVSYDAAGALTALDNFDVSSVSPTGKEGNLQDIHPDKDIILIGESGGGQHLHSFSYSGGSLSHLDTVDPFPSGEIRPLIDPSREVAFCGTAGDDSHIVDISDPSNLSTLHSDTLPMRAPGAVDTARNVFYVPGSGELSAVQWENGSWTVLDTLSNESVNIVTYNHGVEVLFGEVDADPELSRFDVSDLSNITETDEQGSWPNSSRPLGNNRIFAYQSGERLIMAEWDNGYFAVVTTNLLAAPNKPTISVDATGDEYADLSSSAYSHPNDVAHQDSRWQVRQATASNWTNPEYDSGFIGDLEAHTANPIPIEDDLEARVAHRDTNDEFTWSDPVSLTTTGTIKQGEGPEGLFFGEKNGNRILRFGRAFQDDGTNITATLESNHVAPAGAQGEAVFRALHVTVETGTDVDFTFTPIVDGTEDTNAQVTHEHRPSDKTRDTIEVAMAKDVTDSQGSPVAKVGLRGSWFGVKIEATDVLGSGNKVNLEGVELEVEIVREQAGSVNEV